MKTSLSFCDLWHSFRQVYYTSLQNAADGLEVTFWVSDPSDVASEQAGLTSAQLQAMLDAKKDALQSSTLNLLPYFIHPYLFV